MCVNIPMYQPLCTPTHHQENVHKDLIQLPCPLLPSFHFLWKSFLLMLSHHPRICLFQGVPQFRLGSSLLWLASSLLQLEVWGSSDQEGLLGNVMKKLCDASNLLCESHLNIDFGVVQQEIRPSRRTQFKLTWCHWTRKITWLANQQKLFLCETWSLMRLRLLTIIFVWTTKTINAQHRALCQTVPSLLTFWAKGTDNKNECTSCTPSQNLFQYS